MGDKFSEVIYILKKSKKTFKGKTIVYIMTEWKQIANHETYEISNTGIVRNKEFHNERKLEKTANGYLKVKFDNERLFVHELVANAFIDNKFNSKVVLHIDGNKSNNNVSNLKWAYKKSIIAENNNYTINYFDNGTFHLYYSRTGEIVESQCLPRGLSNFTMLTYGDFTATDEDLRKYAKLFKQWCKETRDDGIDYDNAYSDNAVVTKIFNKYCLKYYKHHDKISATEYVKFEKCANNGQQFCVKDITAKCWSYDYKNQYGLILSGDYLIPSKEGYETTLTELPKLSKDLKYGFYDVKITSDNNDFKKVFYFSKHNTYLDVSLRFAMKYRKKFNVKFELIQNGKPNAYLYKDEDMVTLKSITSEWFEKLSATRNKYKSNRLLKHLISTAWGHLNAHNITNKTWEEIENEKLDVGYEDGHDFKIMEFSDYGDRTCFSLLDKHRAYKCNIRLKPWITAYARNLTASLTMKNIDKVVRVQTDSVSFTEELQLDDPNLVLEEKTTGEIHFYDVNCYWNKTTGYKSKGYNRIVLKEK